MCQSCSVSGADLVTVTRPIYRIGAAPILPGDNLIVWGSRSLGGRRGVRFAIVDIDDPFIDWRAIEAKGEAAKEAAYAVKVAS